MATAGPSSARLTLLEKGKQEPPPLSPLFPMLRGMSTLFIGILGMILFGVVGQLAYPQYDGALWGSGSGFVLCLIFGGWVTGFWQDIAPKNRLEPRDTAIDLIVTVHETRNVDVMGRMPWMQPTFYAEVSVGNQVKRTAAKKNGKYNEEFMLQIGPDDDQLIVTIKDEDVFGSRDVGQALVDLQRDVILAGFPWQKPFVIQPGEQMRQKPVEALIVLSFEQAEPVEDLAPNYGAA